jgi:uncharacterized membrane protein
MWGYHWGVGWGWALVGWAMMLAFWGAIAWLLWTAISRGQRPGSGDDDARSIADRRLASGQITHDEHERIVSRLKS